MVSGHRNQTRNSDFYQTVQPQTVEDKAVTVYDRKYYRDTKIIKQTSSYCGQKHTHII